MEESIISKGIPLQLSDIFLQELNKVDAQSISYTNLCEILEPFLYSAAHCRNKILVQRVIERIFLPLLEKNITKQEENSESEEEEVIDYSKKWVDGGKMSKKTEKAVKKLVEQ